ncbi:MAG: hypothetical protein KDI42_07495 [Gammaproteobacteria bacterium]|nr:hypothetical protein [Gammaproteobacteria bacterium]
MKMTARRMALPLILLAGGQSLTGCAVVHGPEQLTLDAIRVERVHSPFIKVRAPSLAPDAGGFVVKGELARHLPGHTPVHGHVHVEVLDTEQRLLRRIDAEPSKTGLISRVARFSVFVDTDPARVGALRVVHHANHSG